MSLVAEVILMNTCPHGVTSNDDGILKTIKMNNEKE
jgi:hypothetical protein